MKALIFLGIQIRKKILLLVLSMTVFINNTSGQVIDVYAVFNDSARMAGQCAGNIYLQGIDTISTTAIEVKIGSSEIDTLAVFKVFDLNDLSALPTGFSYTRNGNMAILQVFSFEKLWTYYCQVRIKSGALWGQPYQFITN